MDHEERISDTRNIHNYWRWHYHQFIFQFFPNLYISPEAYDRIRGKRSLRLLQEKFNLREKRKSGLLKHLRTWDKACGDSYAFLYLKYEHVWSIDYLSDSKCRIGIIQTSRHPALSVPRQSCRKSLDAKQIIKNSHSKTVWDTRVDWLAVQLYYSIRHEWTLEWSESAY